MHTPETCAALDCATTAGPFHTRTAARVEIRCIRGRSGVFERAYLFCPDGHEVVSAPVATTACGARLAAGDFTGESCGYGRCEWSGGVRVSRSGHVFGYPATV